MSLNEFCRDILKHLIKHIDVDKWEFNFDMGSFRYVGEYVLFSIRVSPSNTYELTFSFFPTNGEEVVKSYFCTMYSDGFLGELRDEADRVIEGLRGIQDEKVMESISEIVNDPELWR